MPEPAIGVKLRRASLPRYAPALDNGVAVGEPEQALDVFVDHQDSLSGAAQPPEAAPDLLAHERREAFGRFVEDQEVRVRDEGAADGEHLLLAAGKLISLVVAPFPEAGKEPEHLFRGPGIAPARTVFGKRDQVLANRRRLAEKARVELAWGRQVHGSDIKHWETPGGEVEDVDGHTTTATGLGLLVVVADCYPVALAGDGSPGGF